MLREHYPVDKLFEEILGYVPNLTPELEKIDSYLEDEMWVNERIMKITP